MGDSHFFFSGSANFLIPTQSRVDLDSVFSSVICWAGCGGNCSIYASSSSQHFRECMKSYWVAEGSHRKEGHGRRTWELSEMKARIVMHKQIAFHTCIMNNRWSGWLYTIDFRQLQRHRMLLDGTVGGVLKVRCNSPALQLRAVLALASRSLCSSYLRYPGCVSFFHSVLYLWPSVTVVRDFCTSVTSCTYLRTSLLKFCVVWHLNYLPDLCEREVFKRCADIWDAGDLRLCLG